MAGAIVVALPLAACGYVIDIGPRLTQARDVTGVEALDLRTDGDVVIVVGESESLEVTAGAAVISRLTAEVEDGTLVLDSSAPLIGSGPIAYTLTVRSLDALRIEAAGTVSGASPFGRQGVIEVDGAGIVALENVATVDLTVTIDAAGDVELDGVSESLALTMTGSGGFEGGDLRVASAAISLGGSSDARVFVSDALDATVSGTSDLHYWGDPPAVKTDVRDAAGAVAG